MKRTVVSVHEAEASFFALVSRAAAGEEIVVTDEGKPIARIIPFAAPAALRAPGRLRGQIETEPGFDDLPPGFAEAFGP